MVGAVDLLMRKIPGSGSSLVNRIVPSGASMQSTGRPKRFTPSPAHSDAMMDALVEALVIVWDTHKIARAA